MTPISEYSKFLTNFKCTIMLKRIKSFTTGHHKLIIGLFIGSMLTKFNELIFNNIKIHIHKSLTLPSLAMKIYITHFMRCSEYHHT